MTWTSSASPGTIAVQTVWLVANGARLQLLIVHKARDTNAGTLLAPICGHVGVVQAGEAAVLLANGGANQLLLAELHRAKAAGRAGLFAADPFTVWEEVADALDAAGLSGVVNYPTTGLHDGTFAKALEEGSLGWREELGRLTWFRRRGFEVGVVLCDLEQADRAGDVGAAFVVAHEWAASGEFEELALIARVRARCAAPVLLHGRGWCSAAREAADGALFHEFTP